MAHLSNKDLLVIWMDNDLSNAADVLLALAPTLTVGQRSALKTRIQDDIKASNAIHRANYDDSEADNLDL